MVTQLLMAMPAEGGPTTALMELVVPRSASLPVIGSLSGDAEVFVIPVVRHPLWNMDRESCGTEIYGNISAACTVLFSESPDSQAHRLFQLSGSPK